ncbi:MAG: D-alanyl-D-alanine carboxypeptidase [Oscillospiraceae bacterium]|nr:D-alanyl-D-alanine carboxypeptidase [Oscillospiraceae bacterium]
MKKLRFFALLLSVLLVLQLLLPCAFAEEDVEPPEEEETVEEVSVDSPPELECKGAILVELNSGSTVYEYNADARLFPASVTKIMTCMLALEHGNLSDEITVDFSLIADMDEDASSIGLLDGETMTLEEMLYAVMVPSANDACIVVAAHIAGSVEAFVEMMNQRAQELGCTGTHFTNPDGLHDEDHYTTARDISIITKEALKSETFRTICATAVHELPETNRSAARMVYTTNYFLSTIITPRYYWEKVSGVKTGFTTPAGRCLVALVEQDGYSYLSVVLGAETPLDQDGSPVYGSFTESRKLLEYGLDNFTFAAVLSHLNPIAQVPVSSGAVSSVVVAPVEDVNALLPKNFDPSKIHIDCTLNSGDSLTAPLKADEVVGRASVTYDGREVDATDVRTICAVERNKILATPTKDDPAFLRLVPVLIIIVAVILLIISWLNRRKTRRKRR